ncbi:MAG TPA: hypothetical protein ENI96_10305 [Sedimenticola thiotaurini]|uniref:RNA polymerase sigma factor 70 region 4 type 2 domain-containing protein n=1 Tax=Sedimenticola thiotaurini TaxID=1543721 RepID=A0A831RPH6_9GAMM|nr:hypothetical protein [Sedimenticola thiotaurini]
MNINVSYKRIPAPARAEVERRVDDWFGQHLRPLMEAMGASGMAVHLVVRHDGGSAGGYRVKLHMHVPPKKILVAQGRDASLGLALQTVLERIRRELQRHRERVRHQDEYRRKERRRRLRQRKSQVGNLDVVVIDAANEAIEAVRPRLERAIRRELAYLRGQGELRSDSPTVEEVLDEVVLNVKGRWQGPVERDALYLQLLKEMHAVLVREVEESRAYGDLVSLEQAPPADAGDQAEAMVGEEWNEFWQPDEMLRLEDILPDDEESPEAEVGEMEELAYILELLRHLPVRWRRALLLHRFDGIPLRELSGLFGCSTERVEGWLACSRNYLHEKLVDAGIGSEAAGRFLDAGRHG